MTGDPLAPRVTGDAFREGLDKTDSWMMVRVVSQASLGPKIIAALTNEVASWVDVEWPTSGGPLVYSTTNSRSPIELLTCRQIERGAECLSKPKGAHSADS